jgi:hypothetical protein
MVHQQVDFLREELLSEPTFLEHADESLVALPVDGLEMHMDEIALGPRLTFESPLVFVAESPVVPARIDLAAPAVALTELFPTMQAMLEWLHWRQLAEVSRNYQLNPTKRWLYAYILIEAGLFHHLVEALKVVVLYHADLIDH